MKTAITPTRADNFPEWYQRLVAEADLAVNSPVRGCMIIRPNGYGIWQRIQQLLDREIEATGHVNLYFPLFIPLSFIAKEAEHVEGFAKEMAVVTHHRLKADNGVLAPDPDSKLAEPLIVRPTSETIIGHHFRECVRSYRDLPLLWNQWANVVRWEMRPRLFLRTAEFLWQEGHTAHASRDEAVAETMKMLDVYRSFAEDALAMPVIPGEKPAHERFPGAENTYSIEAMMQDGKALQAGTSHYLGTHFAEAQEIKFQAKSGAWEHCHTTSWGVTTRLIGAVIMTHGDDDGLRAPPRIAHRQVVLVPILRGTPEDGTVRDYCDKLAAELGRETYAGEPIRVLTDHRDERSVEKRWAWIKRGAPLICEIGGRDVEKDNVSFYRRDLLRNGDKLAVNSAARGAFVQDAPELLQQIHDALLSEARARLESNIISGMKSLADLRGYFGVQPDEDDGEGAGGPFRGFVRASWKKPLNAAASDEIEAQLAPLKLTIRNAPLDQKPEGACIFTGAKADEEIIIARAY